VGRKVPDYKIYQSFVKGKRGIEIGGPSQLFKTRLPVYHVVDGLDGVNFSNSTVWEGAIQSGNHFKYSRRKIGLQFISDATDLSQINSGAYDFLLSSNCLEHIANPIKALKEWRRVIKDGGVILLVLPNKESNFDHRRAVTTFDHLVDDFTKEVTERDLTHLDEILSQHDLSMDPPAGNLEEFRLRSLDNFTNRTLHHHVFDIALMKMILEYAGFEILNTSSTRSDFFALGLKKMK
jgi:SAM-dependent methyltransferase